MLLFAKPAGGSSAQADAYFTRLSGLGLSLDATHTNAVTTMINGLVADNKWSMFDALWIFGTQSSNVALINLVSASYPCTINGSPAFVADSGFTFGGSNYLDTGFNGSLGGTVYAQTNAHISYWGFTGPDDAVMYQMGCTDNGAAAVGTWIQTQNTQSGSYPRGTANQPDGAGNYIQGPASSGSSNGWWIMTRITTGNFRLIRNASSIVGSSSTASKPPANLNIFIGGRNLAGTGLDGNASATQFAMASIGSGLAVADSTTIRTRLVNYFTAVRGSAPPQ